MAVPMDGRLTIGRRYRQQLVLPVGPAAEQRPGGVRGWGYRPPAPIKKWQRRNGPWGRGGRGDRPPAEDKK